jgi:hypothetical protein
MGNFINSKGYEYKFTKQDDGNILWEGPFENCKFGKSFVNPHGGPYIKVGQMLSHVIKSPDFNNMVQGFEKTDGGFLIKTNKTNKTKVNINNLHKELFAEEYDFMYDSIADSNDRAKGINPMSKEYQLKVAKKRKNLGVSPLSSSGDSVDDSSWELCKEECEARKNNTSTEKTAIINEVLSKIKKEKEQVVREINFKMYPLKEINAEDPSTWTETMINNCYSKMVAADQWEMEESMSFEDFVKELQSNKSFARSNCPREGMDKEDYNSWT